MNAHRYFDYRPLMVLVFDLTYTTQALFLLSPLHVTANFLHANVFELIFSTSLISSRYACFRPNAENSSKFLPLQRNTISCVSKVHLRTSIINRIIVLRPIWEEPNVVLLEIIEEWWSSFVKRARMLPRILGYFTLPKIPCCLRFLLGFCFHL